MGINRLLTSGQSATALEGAEFIGNLIRTYPEVEIMPGGGITEQNLVNFRLYPSLVLGTVLLFKLALLCFFKQDQPSEQRFFCFLISVKSRFPPKKVL